MTGVIALRLELGVANIRPFISGNIRGALSPAVRGYKGPMNLQVPAHRAEEVLTMDIPGAMGISKTR